MAVTVPPSLNGRPRKQLSDQLDRLDDVINGMEEFLPQAVAEAARDGIRLAFRDVMSEIVTDPLVLDKLRTAMKTEAVPASVPKPSAFGRLKLALNAATVRAMTIVHSVITCVVAAPRAVVNTIKQFRATTKRYLALGVLLTMPLKSIISVGLFFGVTVAAISYIAPHHIAAIIGGLGASASAMAMQIARWLRERQRRLATLS